MKTKVKGIVKSVSTKSVSIEPESNDGMHTIGFTELDYSIFNIGERVTYTEIVNNGSMKIEIRSEDNPKKCTSTEIGLSRRPFKKDIER